MAQNNERVCGCVTTTMAGTYSALRDKNLLSSRNDPDVVGVRHWTTADANCGICGGIGRLPRVNMDWEKACVRLLDCFAGEEGVIYESRWDKYNISDDEKAAILASYNRYCEEQGQC
jgi:hypothetical protein